MATVRDVAKLAGVSPITVSRVINNAGYISEETRKRVEEAIRLLGYVPNTLARSLRLHQTNTLALVLTDITNPFWTTVVRGVEDAASDAGYNVILCNTDESEVEQEKYLNVLLQKRVDGVLLVPVRCTRETVQVIQSQNVPLVVLDRHIPGVEVDSVRGDSEGGAYELASLLVAQGHRKIALLSGPQGVSSADDRVTGYKRALAEDGLDSLDELIYYGEFTQQSGFEMMQRVLAVTPRPTAIFAGNNFITMGAFKAMREAGLKVPDDIALVSFDDLPVELIIDPFFTVASQPAYEMGKLATELILARLAGQAPAACQEIILPTEIIIRRSSGGNHT
jgi:LacI family transcriptional regulator